jgi:hypothetical protein
VCVCVCGGNVYCLGVCLNEEVMGHLCVCTLSVFLPPCCPLPYIP